MLRDLGENGEEAVIDDEELGLARLEHEGELAGGEACVDRDQDRAESGERHPDGGEGGHVRQHQRDMGPGADAETREGGGSAVNTLGEGAVSENLSRRIGGRPKRAVRVARGRAIEEGEDVGRGFGALDRRARGGEAFEDFFGSGRVQRRKVGRG